MRKDKTNFASGFSMAELLISMLIAMVLAAALVPVIGPKKVLNPLIRHYHGIAECFYGADGRLHYFYADNVVDTAPINEEVEGNHCEFRVPNAEFFEVIAIGAGGQGYNGPISELDYTVETANGNDRVDVSYSGGIRIDSNYKSDIDNARGVDSSGEPISFRGIIVDALDTLAERNPDLLSATYSLISPLGKGGEGLCTKVGVDPCDMDNPSKKLNPPAGTYFRTMQQELSSSGRCWQYIHGRGSNSGKGLKSTSDVIFYLKGNSEISIAENNNFAEARVINSAYGDQYAKLKKSGDGNLPTYKNQLSTYVMNQNGENASCESSIWDFCSNTTEILPRLGADHGNEEAPNRKQSGEASTNGFVGFYGKGKSATLEDAPITWEYRNGTVVEARMGLAGDKGEEKSDVYERLTGTLYLFPAFDNNSNTRVARDEAGNHILVRAASGESHSDRSNAIREPVIVPQLPILNNFANKARPQNDTFRYRAKINNAMSQLAGIEGMLTLANCVDSLDPDDEDLAGQVLCPGYAGGGIYPYIDYVAPGYSVTITNKQRSNMSATHYSQDRGVDLGDVSNRGCLNGSNYIRGENPSAHIFDLSDGSSEVYNVYFCTDAASNISNPGAVIIIW